MKNYSDALLSSVLKPGRYVGGEYNQILKDKNSVECRVAFCFPDSYEIGMSNLGMRILYGALNKDERVFCERCFAPWGDMHKKLEENDLPLCTLERGDPLCKFDIVAFTLQYEMCYTNVLNMLSLGKIALLSKERGDDAPIILGGGPCAYNAEPIADFFDVFSIGEGEEALSELADLYADMKKDGSYTKTEFLHRAAKIEGFYVPSFYDVTYNADGTIKEYTPLYDDIPKKIRKRIIADLDGAYFPDKFVVPYVETVQDRISLEVFRGCIRGCRFCQAGMIYRPVREKSPEVLNGQAKCLYRNTGYDEISLISLSISDYSKVNELTEKLLTWTDDKKVNLSLLSLRADTFSEELMDRISSVRQSGLTFAPEAGTQRLRDAINKNVCEEEIIDACKIAFARGKNQVKLYFMIGLPTETDDDVSEIPYFGKRVCDAFYSTEERISRAPNVTLSVACFIPKPFTPFQWDAQDSLEDLERKQELLWQNNRSKHVKCNRHDAKTSRLEAVFARGDRRLSKVLKAAHERGFAFDAWDEFFDYGKWCEVFSDCGIDMSFYANRNFGEDEVLPWDIIDCGVSKEFLLRERHLAYESKTTANCKEKCSGCGASSMAKSEEDCKYFVYCKKCKGE